MFDIIDYLASEAIEDAHDEYDREQDHDNFFSPDDNDYDPTDDNVNDTVW